MKNLETDLVFEVTGVFSVTGSARVSFCEYLNDTICPPIIDRLSSGRVITALVSFLCCLNVNYTECWSDADEFSGLGPSRSRHAAGCLGHHRGKHSVSTLAGSVFQQDDRFVLGLSWRILFCF